MRKYTNTILGLLFFAGILLSGVISKDSSSDPLKPKNLNFFMPVDKFYFGSTGSGLIDILTATFTGDYTVVGDYKGKIQIYFHTLYGSKKVCNEEELIIEVENSSNDAFIRMNAPKCIKSYFTEKEFKEAFTKYYDRICKLAILKEATENTFATSGRRLPNSFVSGSNMKSWSSLYGNYTSGGYKMSIVNPTFIGIVENGDIRGGINLTFTFEYNDRNSDRIRYTNVKTMIRFVKDRVYAIDLLHHSGSLDEEGDINNFLRAWIVNVANPYLSKNSQDNMANTLLARLREQLLITW